MSTPGQPTARNIRVQITHPERFWLAARRDLSWLTDPDEEDQRQRHADRDTIRWHSISAVVQTVGTALKRRSYQQVEDAESHVVEVFVSNPDSLTTAEINIISAWFWGGEMVRSDPWADGPHNGRHRLWGVWSATPDAIVPVYSDLLQYEDSLDESNEEFTRIFLQSAKDGIQTLAPDHAVRTRSPEYIRLVEYHAAKLVDTTEEEPEVQPPSTAREDEGAQAPASPNGRPPVPRGQAVTTRDSANWFARLFRR